MIIDAEYDLVVLVDIVSPGVTCMLTCQVWDISRSLAQRIAVPPVWLEFWHEQDSWVFRDGQVTVRVCNLSFIKRDAL